MDNSKKEIETENTPVIEPSVEQEQKKKKKNKKKTQVPAQEGEKSEETKTNDTVSLQQVQVQGKIQAKTEQKQTEKDPENDEDDKEAQGEGNQPEGEAKKKKKKKKKKNPDQQSQTQQQKANFGGPLYKSGVKPEFKRFQDNSAIRLLKNWEEGPTLQTTPPTIHINDQYPNGNYPVNPHMDYHQNFNLSRSNNAEMKERDKLYEDSLQNLRKAAEVHRQVRKHCQTIIRPGRKLIDICEEIEELNRYLVQENELECGIGFPTGCSLNHVAAHYTPNNGDNTVITYDDVCKIDFGTQVQGRIIDTAFTVAFNPKFDKLLQASKEATETGVREAGIDVRLCDIGSAIQEVMESYEIELDGKVIPIKSVRNLNGHSIAPYKIHAGKSVPNVKGGVQTKMEEGEQYAIETFASTGNGLVQEDMECSHYMKDFDAGNLPVKNPKARGLLNFINKNYGTLAFCRRWLDRAEQQGNVLYLKQLCDVGLVNPYPPLCDKKGSFVAQYEHTFFLKASGKEILSRGDDY